MTGWVIVVDQPKDFPNADTPHKVITTSEYLARPRLFDGGRPKLINLSRSYAYQSKGYYASLLAEARGHRIVPTVETMLELRVAAPQCCAAVLPPQARGGRPLPHPPTTLFPRTPTIFSWGGGRPPRRHLAELAGYDGLSTREPTWSDTPPSRSARRAWQEGMP